MTGLFTLTLSLLGYAATPQQAALRVFQTPASAHRAVERTDVAGDYATVSVRGGYLEGALTRAPILVERFSFGWQALDLVDSRCSLEEHAIAGRSRELLTRGMPVAPVASHCVGGGDAGPREQVEAVRRLMQGPLVPTVVVFGEYALGQWYGQGGGQSLYRERTGSWRRITNGGGAMGVREMRQFGVPPAAWCAFRIYDAHCPFGR